MRQALHRSVTIILRRFLLCIACLKPVKQISFEAELVGRANRRNWGNLAGWDAALGRGNEAWRLENNADETLLKNPTGAGLQALPLDIGQCVLSMQE